MTATNHTLTGALIATAISQPLIALPVALLSHVVLDALPHYGDDARGHTDTRFFLIVGGDATVAASTLLAILILQPAHWLLIIVSAIVAASPDLLWVPEWVDELRHRPAKKPGRLLWFLGWVQWGERPWGWICELLWFVAAGSLLLGRLAQ